MKSKKCNKCNEVKTIDNFYFRKDNNKYRNDCIPCHTEKNKKHRKEIKKANKDLNSYVNKSKKKCYVCLKYLSRSKFYKNINRKDGLNDECIDCNKTIHSNNRDKINKRLNERYATDIEYKMNVLLRNRLSNTIVRNYKKSSSTEYLGCTLEKLKQHLENQFCPHPKTGEAMTWDNWGKYGWHIDHIKPLASFNLRDERQIKQVCHYTNLQPLWAEENLRKGSN